MMGAEVSNGRGPGWAAFCECAHGCYTGLSTQCHHAHALPTILVTLKGIIFFSTFPFIRLILVVLQNPLHKPHSLDNISPPSFTVARRPPLPYGAPSPAEPSFPAHSRPCIPPLENPSSFEPASIGRFLWRPHLRQSSLHDILITTRPCSVVQTFRLA